jgi:cohesin complex subunit SCC1
LLLPDPTLDLADLGILPLQPGHQKRNADITLDPDSFISSLEQPRGFEHDDDLQLEDDILDIDIGEDNNMNIGGLEDLMAGSDSLEIGRDAPMPRDIGEDLFSESRLDLDLGSMTPKARESMPPGLGFEEEGLDLGLDDDNAGFGRGMDIDFEGDTTIQPQEATPVPEATARASEPPAAEPARGRTASVAPTVQMEDAPVEEEQEEPQAEPGDATFVRESSRLSSEEVEETVHARAQGSRKRKVVVDPITEIKAKVIKAQQEDRSRILKNPSFLPRDPTVLALMSLTKSGGLARSIFYPRNIAPELTNLLAPDFVKRMAELKKRKREGAEEQDEARSSPPKQARLEIDHEETLQPYLGSEGEILEEEPRDEMMDLAGDQSIVPFLDQEDDFTIRRSGMSLSSRLCISSLTTIGTASPQPEIVAQGDVTAEDMATMGEPVEEQTYTAPSQPVSRETRHAVHVLREQFAEPEPKAIVRFKELLPPQTTTRVDATKMFFEVLVLATKDAVKVKQSKGFGEIEIQQKKALWGAWAEEKDEQQVAEEEERLREEKDGGRTMNVVVGTGRTVGEATAAA